MSKEDPISQPTADLPESPPGAPSPKTGCEDCPEGLHRCGGCGGCVNLDYHDCPAGTDKD